MYRSFIVLALMISFVATPTFGLQAQTETLTPPTEITSQTLFDAAAALKAQGVDTALINSTDSVAQVEAFSAQEKSTLITEIALATQFSTGIPTNCSDYYELGSVLVGIDTNPSPTVAGTEKQFAVEVINNKTYPIVDAEVYIKILTTGTGAIREYEGLVDEYRALSGITLLPGETTVVPFIYAIPPGMETGMYEVVSYVATADGYNLAGLPYTSSIRGGSTLLMVEGQFDGGLAFVRNQVFLNNTQYNFTSLAPEFTADTPIQINVPVENTLSVPQDVTVTWNLYNYSQQSEMNLLETSTQVVSVDSGDSVPVVHTVTNNDYAAYVLQGEIEYLGVKSILNIRFVRSDIEQVRVNYAGLLNYPSQDGSEITAFTCAQAIGSTGDVSGTEIQMTVLDEEGRVVHEDTFNQTISNQQTLALSSFTPQQNYQSLTLKTTLIQNGAEISTSEITYDCEDILGTACTGVDTSLLAQLVRLVSNPLHMIIGIIGLLLLGMAYKFFTNRTRRDNIMVQSIFFLAVIIGGLGILAPVQAEAQFTFSQNGTFDRPGTDFGFGTGLVMYTTPSPDAPFALRSNIIGETRCTFGSCSSVLSTPFNLLSATPEAACDYALSISGLPDASAKSCAYESYIATSPLGCVGIAGVCAGIFSPPRPVVVVEIYEGSPYSVMPSCISSIGLMPSQSSTCSVYTYPGTASPTPPPNPFLNAVPGACGSGEIILEVYPPLGFAWYLNTNQPSPTSLVNVSTLGHMSLYRHTGLAPGSVVDYALDVYDEVAWTGTTKSGVMIAGISVTAPDLCANQRPNPPTITGPTPVIQNTLNTYTLNSTDPESDALYYEVDVTPDGVAPFIRIPNTSGTVPSGTDVSLMRMFSPANPTFWGRACDAGGCSTWSEYTVQVNAPAAITALLELNVNNTGWTASDQTINFGDEVRLRWSSTNNPATCTGTGFNTGGATSNTAGVIVTNPAPADSSEFSISCIGSGTPGNNSVRVTTNGLPLPVITLVSNIDGGAFTAGNKTIDSGQQVRMQWTALNATNCTGIGADSSFLFSGNSGSSGIIEPGSGSNGIYGVRCTNAVGNATTSLFNVETRVTPPNPTLDFEYRVNSGSWTDVSASVVTVNAGESVEIRWLTSDVDSCVGTNFNAGSGNGPVSLPTNTAGTDTYRIDCLGDDGSSIGDDLTLTVNFPNFTEPPITITPGTPDLATGIYDTVLVESSAVNDGAGPVTVSTRYTVELDENSTGAYRPALGGSVGAVAAGANQTFSETFTSVPLGDHTYRVCVDTPGNGVVDESSETDNCRMLIPGLLLPDPQMSISAEPTLLRAGEQSRITWSTVATYPGLDCTVSGLGINQTGLSGTQLTPSLSSKVIYTFECSVGSFVFPTEIVAVEIVGEIEEI